MRRDGSDAGSSLGRGTKLVIPIFTGSDPSLFPGWCDDQSESPECPRIVLKHCVGLHKTFHRPILTEHCQGDAAQSFESLEFLKAVQDVGGVSNMTAAPHHSNGISPVDRFVRTVQDLSRTQMEMAEAPATEWPHSNRHAVFVHWRTPHQGVRGVTPFEMIVKSVASPNMCAHQNEDVCTCDDDIIRCHMRSIGGT